MYLLDTNVISMLDPRRRSHAPALIEWLETHGGSLYLSVMTITEMEAGALKLRRDKKHERAGEIEGLIEAVLVNFRDRVLDVDVETARHVARLGASVFQAPVALPDLIIAATAVRHGLMVLTRNMKDFERLGIGARDPFEPGWTD